VPLAPGFIYIGRGDADIVVETRLGRRVVNSVASDPTMVWHPSVARLVRSAMEVLEPRNLVSVQLTGMGDDGADAMVELRRLGGRTIAEDESTAIVFGMPAELIRRGGATTVLPSHRIASQLTSWLM
ncbi:CheB methylesterase domain-containing protein, partial [Rhodoplanes sp. SY1]|uniref:CheB methylesterase domain-containing protein n=1 Tax=Rhodoplanes sp. SY1 TaxID=3166646 RepID=UPI0038B53381